MESSHLTFEAGSHGNKLHLGSSNHLFRVGARSVLSMETLKQRPFYRSHEELIEEENYDEQLPEKKRRLTPEQVHLLERSFEAENKLEPERKTQLAKKLGLQPRQVAVWFQNRRSRWKTKQLERDFDLLKSSFDSLTLNYDNALKEKEMLMSEVRSLTEKLQERELAVDQLPPATAVMRIELGGACDNNSSGKGDDLIRYGSGGSAVFGRESPQVLDSGDSHYSNDVGSNDGNDGGHGYFGAFFDAGDKHHDHEQEQTFGWWVWS